MDSETRLPAIYDHSKDLEKSTIITSHNNKNNGINLPDIKQSVEENPTAQSPILNEPKNEDLFAGDDKLPKAWTDLRVNDEQSELQKSKLDWENQVARHILSVFATTSAVTDVNESSKILEFVDRRFLGLAEEKHSHALLVGDNIEENEYEDDEKDEKYKNHENKFELIDEEEENKIPEKQETPKRKKKLKKKKKLSKSKSEDLKFDVSSEFNEDHKKKLQQVMDLLETEKQKPKRHDKFRRNNTIKMADGREILIRGNPRVYPIWFASSGDIFVDWTKLPGSMRLQAHLNSIYEKKQYEEYVTIIESLLLHLYQQWEFGDQEFSVGSFGNSMKYHTAPTIPQVTRKTKNLDRKASTKYNMGSYTDDLLRAELGLDFGNPIHYDVRGTEHQPMTPLHEEESLGGSKTSLIGSETHSKPAETTSSKSSIKSKRSRRMNPEPLQAFGFSKETLDELWEQLILTAIAMGVLCSEAKQFSLALKLFNKAESWCSKEDYFPNKEKRVLMRAHVRDGMGFYFYRRKQPEAAIVYCTRAQNAYNSLDFADGVGITFLHIAAIFCQQGDFKESHKKIFEFLGMVEEGKMAQSEATPKQLCLVAIAYHNLAVVQLKLRLPDLACKSSQNARKLARLCLSYSNRWINLFQYTHEVAINDIKYELSNKGEYKTMTKEQQFMIDQLSEAMFHPFAEESL